MPEICLFVEVLKIGLIYSIESGGGTILGFWVISCIYATFPALYLFSTKEVYSLKPRETPRLIIWYK